MPSLHELQRHVMAALLDGCPGEAIPLVAAPPDEAAARLSLYRNNAHLNFEDALRSSFPAVARLVGADHFRYTARLFQRVHPSHSGDLSHAGAPFADYLATLHRDDGYGYLAEVARLEWLVQEALLAAPTGTLDYQALSRVSPAAYDELIFLLNPSARLFESDYPALQIWEENVGKDAPQTIDLRSGGDRLALLQRRMRLEYHRVSIGEFRFLSAVRHATAFASAVDGAAAADPDFEAAAALRRFVTADIIVGFTAPAT